MEPKKKVLVSERIADEGIEVLKTELDVDYLENITREELLQVIDQYDALVVRSVTKVDEELIAKGVNLKIVGRAGNGVDNIDVPTCSRYGVMVANTPDSNTISAAEQTIALLLASCRNTAWASETLKGGVWDRKPFRGVELYGKTVGIVGLGRIGSMVATRLGAFNMKVIAYDPYIPDERFERFGAEKKATLAELVQESDFISVHTPKTEETFHMINAEMLTLARDGVRLVNCARGGIIEESAIIDGLKSKKVASAGIDVFEKEPDTENQIFSFANTVVTPHLGADTFEAQKRVGEDIAHQVIKALQGEIVPNLVNLPAMLREELDYLRPYITLAEKMGNLCYQMKRAPMSRVELTFSGPITRNETEILTAAFLKGLLEPVMGEKVSYVNSRLMAEDRGVKLHERRLTESNRRYRNIISAQILDAGEEVRLEGSTSRAKEPILVGINGYETEAHMEGYIVIAENIDKPGVIGRFTTILGEVKVNIAGMTVARHRKGEEAIMLVNVDNKVESHILDQLEKVDGILKRPILLHL